MEGQDILKLVELIDHEKKEKQNQRRKKSHQKDKEKELFGRWEAKCVCSGIFTAKGLRECIVCHEIKKSTCSKASCCIDRINPKMITTATTTSTRRKVKYEDESDSDESDNFDEEECDAF